MIDIPIISKVLEVGVKAFQRRREKREEDAMQSVLADLRRRSKASGGNCLTATAGSEEDRLYQKMVAKGYLVRIPLGYMLPEFYNDRAL